jgi:hypothetical protein
VTLTCDICGYPIQTQTCRDSCGHRTHCDCKRDTPTRTAVGQTADGKTVTDHAVMRWWQRTPVQNPPRLEVAWERAVSVGASDVSGTVRLYEPLERLIVAHGGKIRTVMYADAEELNTDHLKQCEYCDQLWNPSDPDVESCTWCEGDDSDSEYETVSVTGKP